MQKEKATDYQPVNKLRITLTSRDLKAVEKVCQTVLKECRAKQEDAGADSKTPLIKVKGPIRMPTKNLRITTRKTPCGEGSKTWDRYQMRIYKRVIDLSSETGSVVEYIRQIQIDGAVEIEVTTEG